VSDWALLGCATLAWLAIFAVALVVGAVLIAVNVYF